MLQMPRLPWTFQKESLTGDISTDGYNNVRLISVNIEKQKVGYSIIFSRENLIFSVSFRLLVHFLNSCPW
jgi:hypothetical protein